MTKSKDILYGKAQDNDGLLTTKEIEELGIGRHNIKKYIEDGFLVKESHGIYSVSEELPDEYASFQKRSEKIIYSYNTALFFHGLSDRVPRIIDITLPQGYNANRFKKYNENIRIHYVKQDVLNIGVEYVKTPQGCTVKAYNKERCICDIIKHKSRVEKQIYTHAIKTYFTGIYNPKDIIEMSLIIGVEDEVRNYMEVL